MRRTALFVIAAVLFASASVLWAGTYKAAEEMGDLTRGLPLTIAASTVSISASSVTPLAYLVPPYTSERSDAAAQLCPMSLAPIQFS